MYGIVVRVGGLAESVFGHYSTRERASVALDRFARQPIECNPYAYWERVNSGYRAVGLHDAVYARVERCH